jgi:hypothetical protein
MRTSGGDKRREEAETNARCERTVACVEFLCVMMMTEGDRDECIAATRAIDEATRTTIAAADENALPPLCYASSR